jgi:oligosaccharide repeat unit polymerase
MIKLFSILILFVVYLIPFLFFVNKEKINFFRPEFIFSFFSMFSIGALIIAAVDPFNYFAKQYLFLNGLNGVENIFLEYSLLHVVGFLSFFIGCRSTSGSVKSHCFRVSEQNYNLMFKYSLLFFLLFLLTYLVFVISVGGFEFLIRNMLFRSQMSLSNGYIIKLINIFSFFSVVFLGIYSSQKKDYRVLFLIFIMVLIALSRGGRASAVLLVLIFLGTNCFFSLRTGTSRIGLFRKKYALYFLFIFVIVVAMPIIRNNIANFDNISNFHSSVEINTKVSNFFRQNQTVNNEFLALDYFEENDFWYGKIYLNLLIAPIPRSFLSEKPATDDGVYIFNMLAGKVDPNDSFENLYKNSWPISDVCMLYINFSLIGVAFFMYIKGKILTKIYFKIFESDPFNGFFNYLFYLFLVFKFQITCYYLVQVILFAFVFYFIRKIIFLKKKKVINNASRQSCDGCDSKFFESKASVEGY